MDNRDHSTYVRQLIIQAVEDGSLLKIASRINPESAEDLVGDAIIKLLERPHLYVEGNFKGFMRIIMYRDDMNKKRRERVLYLADIPKYCTPLNMKETSSPDSRILTTQILASLNTKDEHLLTMLLQGFKHREISDLLGVNINTIGARIRRLYADLKEKLIKNESRMKREID
jgi:RNA polymerase sigma factor (sigma-70 family)